jgi:hypothetical protein
MNRNTLAAALLLALGSCLPALAQAPAAFKDTAMLRAPAGARVDRYKVPLVRHDFPLKMHIWSFDAAVIARYIQDKISPQAAEEYRRAVFASQISIASKEDLNAFTQKYFQSHGRQMPFVIDPNGLFTAEVHADQTLGERIGLVQTPTIFIVTQKGFTEVKDITQLYAMLDTAISENPAPAPARARTTAAHK